MFTIESSTMLTIATRFCVFSPTSMLPNTIGPTGMGATFQWKLNQLFEEIEGKNTPMNLPNATPTAAIVPHWITRKYVQP
jgi:hypothetical protein